jgi:hypothetical protein
VTLVETGDMGIMPTRIWGEVLLNCVSYSACQTKHLKLRLPAVSNTNFASDIFDPVIQSSYEVCVFAVKVYVLLFQRHLVIKMDLQGVGCRGLDWIHLAQDRDRWRALVKAVVNLRVP